MRVKVFESGDYPQGKYSVNKVKELFGNIKDKIDAVIIHTSDWINEKRVPVIGGNFSNFSVDNGKAYADLEFNEKGQSYFNDGFLKGISVEIRDGITNIALLPINQQQQIAGAEFAEVQSGIEFAFEEMAQNINKGVNMTIDEVVLFLATLTEEQLKEFATKLDKKQGKEIAEYTVKNGDIATKLDMINCVKGSITAEEKAAARTIAYEFAKATEEPAKVETVEEIEARIEAKHALKDKKTKETLEFSAKLKEKVLPKYHGVFQVAFEAAQEKTDIIEFSADVKETAMEHVMKVVESCTEAESLRLEFKADNKDKKQLTAEEKAAQEVSEAKKRTEGG
jgi:hypothetical protein